MTTDKALEIIGGKTYHEFYHDACRYAMDIAIHADEGNPMSLLTERRPKESEKIQEYRKKIYIEKTEAPVFKVMNSLMKIRKSQDWMIKFPEKENAKIKEEERLENYTEKNFPKRTSFTNWFYEVCFKQYLIDANAVSLVMPENVFDKDYKADESLYVKPYPIIYNSHQVLSYSTDHYLLKSEEKNHYKVNNTSYEGNIFYLVDDQFIYEIKEIDPKPLYTITSYEHKLGFMPVVKLGGIVKKEKKHTCLYKSRISPMVPELKEALREYSDLQAEIVQHVHSTLWYYAGQSCAKCKGTGKVIGKKDSAPIECKSCGGSGRFPFNPYENFETRPPNAGEPQVPTPPAGYLTKQIDIAKLQDQRVQDHIFNALSSINFEFLAKSPLNQSGYAKDVDKSELNNFVHSVAEDKVRIFDEHYYIFCEYRYRVIVPNPKDRKALLPFIPVPQKYDILSEEYVLDEIVKLKEKSVDTAILNAALIDYANKKFGNDEKARDYIITCIELDPFASESEDVLLSKLQNGGISKLKYTVHCNIKDFVKTAISNDEEFCSKPFPEKQKVVEGLASVMIKENSAQGKVIQMIKEDDTTGDDSEAAAAN